jgi:hypothetical protein
MAIDGVGRPPVARPRRFVEELLAAKSARPIGSIDDLAAETFESDDELNEFLAFTSAERRRETG